MVMLGIRMKSLDSLPFRVCDKEITFMAATRGSVSLYKGPIWYCLFSEVKLYSTTAPVPDTQCLFQDLFLAKFRCHLPQLYPRQ